MRRVQLKFEISFLTLFLLAMLIGCAAAAGTIKTWGTSDTLTAADLNGNFQHIHNLMVGGHGARLVDADVNASAAIASSKLAAYRYLPVAWASATAVCSAGTCATVGAGFSAVNYVSTGIYTASFSATRTDSNFGTFALSTTSGVYCSALPTATTYTTIVCTAIAGGAATNAQFNVMVMDDN